MPFKVFISSVQREFAVERKLLAEYIRKDVILGRFFEVFLFEDVPAQERSASDVYLSEVDASDIYLGILGATYGHVDRKGVSATEREYERAEKKQKERICFVKTVSGEREPAEAKFVERVNAERTRKGFADWDGLRVGVYSALANYLGNKGLISVLPFDSSKSAGVQLKDLDAAKMREFIRDAREIRGFKMSVKAKPIELLTALELLDDEGRIANSAALLFGKRPQRFFPCSEVKCAWFLTYEVAKPIEDYQIYEGDVFEMADQATAFVMSHISRRIGEHDGEKGAAPTHYELPRKAVFEAIVNAICHRDYTSNASVQVMLFPDRLEILSPGPLPKGMTIALLHRRHRSIPVNPLLARAMFFKGYIEKVGSGTRDMIERCREWGIELPRWENDDGDFAVTLRRISVAATAEKNAPRTTTHTTTQTTIQTTIDNLGLVGGAASVLRAILSHPTANLKELASLLGMTKDGDFYHVRNLRSIGLRHVGARDRGRWTLGDGEVLRASDVTENVKGMRTAEDVSAGKRVDKCSVKSDLKTTQKTTQKVARKTTQKILESIECHPRVTRQQLSEIIGITPDGVKKALEGLKSAGLLRRVGPDKGGHWEVVGLK